MKAPLSHVKAVKRVDESVLHATTGLSPQILVEVKDVMFQVGEIEPLFCSLAIWNLEQSRKVTEEFHFDFNSDKMLGMLKTLRSSLAPELLARRALFTLPPKTALGDPHYYFVLLVDALWCEDPDEKLKTYSKGAVRISPLRRPRCLLMLPDS